MSVVVRFGSQVLFSWSDIFEQNSRQFGTKY